MGSTSGKFTTPGTSTLVLPYGATLSSISCWGAGGHGATMTRDSGGGAGGGAFSTPDVGTPETLWNATLRIIVGAGGNDSVVDGENSSVAFQNVGDKGYIVIVEAGGGLGCDMGVTTGAKGGTVVTGLGYAGGFGAAGGATTSGGGGGGAGNAEVGGTASGGKAGIGGKVGGGAGGNGVTGNSAGNNGTAYGGGGAGASRATLGTSIGGTGADGAVYLTVDWPDNVPLMILTDSGVT